MTKDAYHRLRDRIANSQSTRRNREREVELLLRLNTKDQMREEAWQAELDGDSANERDKKVKK